MNNQDRFKFRAWDKKAKEMIPEVFIWTFPGLDITVWYDEFQELKMFNDGNWPDHWYYCAEADHYGCEGEHVELMQSTGLHDKKDVLIFESDIVRSVYKDGLQEQGMIAEIKFCPHAGYTPNHGMAFDNSWLSHEIIGNIHQSPHLLQKDE